MTERTERLVRERHRQALRDLRELEAQVSRGEVSPRRAAAFHDTYLDEAASALAELDVLEATATEESGPSHTSAEEDGAAGARTSWRSRRVVGAVFGVAVAMALTAAVTTATGPRPPGGFVTGNEAGGDLGAGSGPVGGRDLSEVTNDELEQVVAENPDVIGMRLALAHRYLDEDDGSRAIDHYLEVLDRREDPEAMSHVGWLVFQDGEVELAASLLEASLEQAPDDPEGLWFLANVRLYGQERPDEAVELLERVLADDNLGGQREAVVDAIDDAYTMAGEPDRAP